MLLSYGIPCLRNFYVLCLIWCSSIYGRAFWGSTPSGLANNPWVRMPLNPPNLGTFLLDFYVAFVLPRVNSKTVKITSKSFKSNCKKLHTKNRFRTHGFWPVTWSEVLQNAHFHCRISNLRLEKRPWRPSDYSCDQLMCEPSIVNWVRPIHRLHHFSVWRH
jgi:hypothetical protein